MNRPLNFNNVGNMTTNNGDSMMEVEWLDKKYMEDGVQRLGKVRRVGSLGKVGKGGRLGSLA